MDGSSTVFDISSWFLNADSLKIDTVKFGDYATIFESLAKSKPQTRPLVQYKKENPKIQRFQDDNEKFTIEYLSSLLKVSEHAKSKLKESYHKYMGLLGKRKLPIYGSFHDGEIKGKGIVMVGGGKFSWLALLNIHQLRKVGSNLPVEVYIPVKRDYDETFCSEILTDLNARCVLGYEDLPLSEVKSYFRHNRFQHKSMAILASKFEDILLLDADNVVTQAPDGLFNWDTYKEFQLVLWPDCWVRTTNPFIYELFGIKLGEPPQNALYDLHQLPGAIPNPSTESGMMLINKKTHANTMLLALYMNMYGLDYFYPLITQGGAGEGDKDTYITAAFALNQPVYQVQYGVNFVGSFDYDGAFTSGGLGQCNPMDKIERYIHDRHITTEKCPDYMFIHMNHPKYYPDEIADNFITNKGRYFLEFENINLKDDYDFELQIWEILTQLLCDGRRPNDEQPHNPASTPLDPKYLLSARGMRYIKSLKMDKICKSKILPRLQFLRGQFKVKEEKKNNKGQ